VAPGNRAEDARLIVGPLSTAPALRLLWPAGFAFYLSFFLLLSALPLYALAAGISDRSIGFVIGAFAVASMLTRPWAGWAADRFGRRPLMLAGTAIFFTASLAYGVSRSVWALLLVRLLHGAGMGLYPTAAAATSADLAPPDRRGEVLGFVGAAANLAMALGPIAGMAITDGLGFVPLFGIAATAALTAMILTRAMPETLTEPDTRVFRPRAAFSSAALFPSAIGLCMMLTFGAQVSFLPIYAHEHGVNPGIFFLVYALVVAFVRGYAGRLSDRLGRASVTAGGLVVASGGLTILAFTRDSIGLTAAGALYGIGFGTASPAIMAWCLDAAPPRDRGRAMGTFYTAFELGIALGAMSSGLAVSAFGFTATFFGAAVVAIMGAGLAWWDGTLRRRPRPA